MRIPFLLLLALPALAQDDAELKQRLDAAEERIATLERERAAADRADIEKAVEAYLESAPPAPSASTPLAGYGPVPFRNGCGCGPSEVTGFYVRDEAGDFLLRLGGQIQVRLVGNEQEDSLGDPHVWGFEIPRAKLVLSGNLFGPEWTYKVQGNYDSDGGAFTLEDAWVTWYRSTWSVTAGQFKCPALREEIVDSAYQLAVERSVVNDALTSGERFQGVSVGYLRETWRLTGAFTDGDGTANTPALGGDTDYAFTFRGELLLDGDFAAFEDFTSFRGDAPGVLLGFNAHVQRAESGVPGPQPEVLLLAADASFEFGGGNFFVEGVWVQVEESGAGGTRDLFGVVTHGGWFLSDAIEVFGRYEYADLDRLGLSGDVSILTFGANRYFHRHRIKLTGDVGYAFDAVPVTTKYSGFREDVPFAKGQVVVRVQLQILF
jgi:hypothetical protein